MKNSLIGEELFGRQMVAAPLLSHLLSALAIATVDFEVLTVAIVVAQLLQQSIYFACISVA